MHKYLHILSQAISILVHPMLVPTYGIILYMLYMLVRTPDLPMQYVALCIGGTLIFTAVIPLGILLIMRQQKHITSLALEKPSERTLPYIYTMMCYFCWIYFIDIVQLPKIWLWIVIASSIALGLTLAINLHWKISAHLTALGGLLGSVFSLSAYYNFIPTPLIIIVLGIALLTMFARIYLNAHTPLQVVCGFLMGLGITLIPIIMI